MAGRGTGYPIRFHCPAWRAQYPRPDACCHEVTLTGRVKRMKLGNGHPRKSWTAFEYDCGCGHTGWSSHRNLEDRAAREGIPGAWPNGGYGPEHARSRS